MKQYLSIILSLFPLWVFSQVQFEFKTNLNDVTVGDVMEWTYIIKDSDGEKIDLDFEIFKNVDNVLNQKDSLASESIEVEILESNRDLNQLKGLTTGDTISMKVAVYDIALFSAPLPTVEPEDLDIQTEEMPMIIVGIPQTMMQQDSLQLNDIKGIIKEEKTWKDYLKPWHLLLLIIPLLIVLFIWYRKKNKQEVIEEEVIAPIIPAHVTALEKLELLKSNRSWEGDNKVYHSELTRIVRQYLNDRYNVNALEMTTSQTVQAMKNTVSNTQLDDIERLLNSADIVKFAKGEVEADMNYKFLEEAIQFVNETKMA